MAVFEAAVREDADVILVRYPEAHRRSAVMPLLYLAQSVEGSVTRDALREIGTLLGITTAEVEGWPASTRCSGCERRGRT